MDGCAQALRISARGPRLQLVKRNAEVAGHVRGGDALTQVLEALARDLRILAEEGLQLGRKLGVLREQIRRCLPVFGSRSTLFRPRICALTRG